jgi:hypothetical protein
MRIIISMLVSMASLPADPDLTLAKSVLLRRKQPAQLPSVHYFIPTLMLIVLN